MKVLHLISGGDSGGAKTHVFALLESLKKIANVRIICFTDGIFYKEIMEKDIDSLLLPQKSRFDLSVIPQLIDIINKDGYDVIHSHGARANFITWQIKSKISCPVVTTVHSDYLLDFDGIYKKLIYTSLNKMALRKMDYYIAVSSNFKDMLISRGFKPNLIFTVYNGMNYDEEINYVPKEEFAKRLGINYNPKDKYVGIIGRHDHVKGHDIFIKAAKEVCKKVDNVKFIIAGQGDGEEKLKNMARDFGIEDKVIFAGFVNDIYSFINFIDINTLSSRSESFPYVLLEGARLKKPVVSSRVGGIPDLISEDETGLLFENGDYKGFANQLIRLIKEPDTCKRLGNALYEKATSNFSSENLARTHMDIYETILKYEKDDKKYDIVLSGYYGFDNSGDDALLFAILEGIKKYKPNLKALVLSAKPRETQKVYRTDSKNRFNPFSIIYALKNSKILINGGGSLIQDATSSQSLWYYLGIMKAAKKCGAKLYIYANGIGPIKKRNENLVKKITNSADMITLRDEMSMEELKRMNITKPPVFITADPAVELKGSSKSKVEKIFKIEDIPLNKSYIGISVRNWTGNDKMFEEKIAKVADYAASNHGLIPVFIPMKYNSDLKLSERIIKFMENKAYVLKNQYSVQDTIGVVAALDVIIGMRLHTLIYAAGSSVPAIGLIYDPKIKGFLEYIGQSRGVMVENIEVEKLMGYIDEIYNNKTQIVEKLKENTDILKEKALQNAKIALKLLEN